MQNIRGLNYEEMLTRLGSASCSMVWAIEEVMAS